MKQSVELTIYCVRIALLYAALCALALARKMPPKAFFAFALAYAALELALHALFRKTAKPVPHAAIFALQIGALAVFVCRFLQRPKGDALFCLAATLAVTLYLLAVHSFFWRKLQKPR